MNSRLTFAIVLGGTVVLLAAALVPRLTRSAAERADTPFSTRSDGFSFTNHLITEKSPYLQQHAHNPVDWYPWGKEAFRKARQENKPIFLSVGYSTCHWCHVMAHESFENPQIARILNDNFVCVKVDREERPDLDQVYLTFVQATTGSGGWPMTVWLTPELEPFFGGTYFPPDYLTTLLLKISTAWHTNPERIKASSNTILRQLRTFTEAHFSARFELDTSLLDKCYEQIRSRYEPLYGGFGSAPKFPSPVILNFLLRYYARTGTNDALEMSLFTLHKMADGGIHDQIGGGFHRYSTDARWHVPHFEKMLDDQAQLACSYLEAYQITHDESYADTARDILAYVQRNLTGRQGQFFSAEDADSPLPRNPTAHGEGAFYVWEEKEIIEVLGKESAEVFNYLYGVERHGNVGKESRGELGNKNVLIVSHTVEQAAKQFDKSPDDIRKILADARQKLFAVRAKRPRPSLDDKTITAWNGLMISAFARAYQVFDDPQFLSAATGAAQFVKAKLYDPKTGKLLRRYRAGEAAIDGFANDYAFLIQGLLDLDEASLDIKNLAWAFNLEKKQNELFWDSVGKGFFSTTGSDSTVLLRGKEDSDGAQPSPNSIAALNLLRLSQMLDEKSFRAMAEKALAAFGARLRQAPSAIPQMMVALDFRLAKPKQIVIAGKPDASDTRAMFRAVHKAFLPDKIVLLADGGEGQAYLAKHLGCLQGLAPQGGKATAFVCQNYVCQLPTTDVAALVKELETK